MTVTIHTRNRGATIRCDYYGCKTSLTTGQILIKPIRAYAKSQSWIRGLDPGSGSPNTGGGRPSNRKADICPEHAVDERRKHDERNAAKLARQAKRDAFLKLSPEEQFAERKRQRNVAAKARRQRRAKLAALTPQVAA